MNRIDRLLQLPLIQDHRANFLWIVDFGDPWLETRDVDGLATLLPIFLAVASLISVKLSHP